MSDQCSYLMRDILAYCSPFLCSWTVALLIDLEPGCWRSRCRIVDLSHIDDDGSIVISSEGQVRARSVTGLCVHLNCDVLTSYKMIRDWKKRVESRNIPVTGQIVLTGFVPALHTISAVETLVTGLLLRGRRAQVDASSTLSKTHQYVGR